MTKKQVTCSIDKDLLKKFEILRNETGLPVSRLIDLSLKGYKVVRFKEVIEND